MKKKIEVYIKDLDSCVFEGTLQEIVDKLIAIPTTPHYNVKGPFLDFKINVEYYGYDGGKEFQLIGIREETDEEYQKRELAQQKANEEILRRQVKKEKDEKQLYEKLKKKFENV